ncbi:MAG: GNAT family N-acetyltransferase, partial [Acidimicrobiia bacterium]
MNEIHPASAADLPQIVELLDNANDTPYDLARVAEEKCFGAGVSGPPHALIATSSGVLAGIAVACGNAVRLLAVHRAHRRKSIGSNLLREAEKWIEANGGRKVNLGAEPGNYFVPGIPRNDEGMH